MTTTFRAGAGLFAALLLAGCTITPGQHINTSEKNNVAVADDSLDLNKKWMSGH